MKIVFDTSHDTLEVACTGSFDRQAAIDLVDAIQARLAQAPGAIKCVLDVTGAEIDIGIMGEFILGEYAARKLAGLRISLIRKDGQIKKLFEDAAFNRGLRILMVENREQALAWLNG
jgi:hypothetical protein